MWKNVFEINKKVLQRHWISKKFLENLGTHEVDSLKDSTSAEIRDWMQIVNIIIFATITI